MLKSIVFLLLLSSCLLVRNQGEMNYEIINNHTEDVVVHCEEVMHTIKSEEEIICEDIRGVFLSIASEERDANGPTSIIDIEGLVCDNYRITIIEDHRPNSLSFQGECLDNLDNEELDHDGWPEYRNRRFMRIP